MLSHSGLKTTKFVPSSANCSKMGPDSSQVASSGPSYPNWLNRCYHCFYLHRFQNSWSSKLNNLSFDQNIYSRLPFCFVNISAHKSRTEMVVYSKFAYGSQFSGGKGFENPILGCWDIKRNPSLILFGTPCKCLNWHSFQYWSIAEYWDQYN